MKAPRLVSLVLAFTLFITFIPSLVLAEDAALTSVAPLVTDQPSTPCSGRDDCISPTPPTFDVCPESNNTRFDGLITDQPYDVLCEVDFPSSANIYPFVLAETYGHCLRQCDRYNALHKGDKKSCQGFVFAPERVHMGDDCYLKFNLDNPFPATIPLHGATKAAVVTTIKTVIAEPTNIGKILAARSPTALTNPGIAVAPGTPDNSALLKVPTIIRSKVHGASVNRPTSQWVYHEPVLPMRLQGDLLKPGINCDLITQFELAPDTGTLSSDASIFSNKLVDLSVVPHLSRDGGKGGHLNGQHLFIFCDTASFTTCNETQKGEMVGFTSSSVAIDEGHQGELGDPLLLVDGIGQWNDDVGRMRGYSPMTNGEHSFNIELSGKGYRYAVWPMSSIISLNKTHALQYAALVYDEVNMDTQDAKFTTIGNTLLTISLDEQYGPTAERTVKRLFQQGEVQWGTIGGLRSWGSDGVGGMDGKIYVFGQTTEGILVARSDAVDVAKKDAYEYWTGSSWDSRQLPATATSFIVQIAAMDVDIFYSPRHQTFIMVYLTRYADNIFYYRYLDSPHPILPSNQTNAGKPDIVENIVKYPWSEERLLLRVATPKAGNYIYAGSVHTGYFRNEDIVNGGTKMLLTWTEKTGEDAASPRSGYAHMSAAVVLD